MKIQYNIFVGGFMKNLYIDFDGVIVDTIRVTYDMLDRLEVDKKL